MKKLISLSFIAVISILYSCHEQPIMSTGSAAFNVDIISGSDSGSTYMGKFTYDIRQVNWILSYDTVPVQSLGFNYRGIDFSEETLDFHPYLVFQRGNLICLFLSGRTADYIFSLNDSAGRANFTRPHEVFVRNYENYFGYLDENGNIDGAGRVKYIPIK